MPPKTRKAKVVVQPTTVEEWLEAKVKQPTLFTTTNEGMLFSPPIGSGDTERVIPVQPRVPATREHIQTQFENRKSEIISAEEQFTEARRNVYRVTAAFRAGLASAGDVVIANLQAKEAEAFLVEKGFAPRGIEEIVPEPMIRELLFDNRYLVSKVPDPVYRITRATFPWTYFYETRLQETEEESAEETVADKEEEGKPKRNYTPEERARIGAIIRARSKKRLVLPNA